MWGQPPSAVRQGEARQPTTIPACKTAAAQSSLPPKPEAAMPLKPILQLGNPILRQKSLLVANPSAPEIAALIHDLADTLAHWRSTTGYGRGIAAPQLGVLKRVVFLQLTGEKPWPFINPEIIERSKEKIVVWDACLSFLSIFMQVERHREITVRYLDLEGTHHEFRAGDDRNLSELLQHEIDHLEGILAVDRIVDIKTLCTREEFETRHRAASPYAIAPANIES
jgi:peptide deformylase